MVSNNAMKLVNWLTAGSRLHDVSSCTDADGILVASFSDYHVGIGRLLVAGLDEVPLVQPDGGVMLLDSPREGTVETSDPDLLPWRYACDVGDQRVTVRENKDGSRMPFAVVGSQYVVTQNREIVEDALLFLGESSDDDCGVVYAGNFRQGRKFTVGVAVSDLRVDIGSHTESFVRTVDFATGHDGTLAHWTIFSFTDAETNLQIETYIERRKHFKHVKDRVKRVSDAISAVKKRSEELTAQVQELAHVQLPVNSALFDEMSGLCATEYLRQANLNFGENTDAALDAVSNNLRSLFLESGHSGTRGANAWALYVAFLGMLASAPGGGEPTRMHGKTLENSRHGESNRRLRLALIEAAKLC